MENQQLTVIWQRIAETIRRSIGPDAFERWFKAVELESADETQLELKVPNTIYQFWIESNFMPVLRAAVIDEFGGDRQIRFRPAQDGGAALPAPEALAETAHRRRAVPAERRTAAPGLPNGMNWRHNFESFVVGPANEYAHAAALGVAHAPARTYNPLFLFGGTGLGKTHLLHAVGHHVTDNKRDLRVVYVSSEQFTNDFIDAIQNNTLAKFRKRYRQADVLLIDDIHFLAGKERCQEEFFHTFNTLFDGHKQIVLASDRPPAEIPNLEQRLVSRFEWGLTAELQPPDVETRLAILRKKAEAISVRLPPPVLEFLAEHIRTSIRTLEGALMRVASYASLNNRLPTPEAAEELLKDLLHAEAGRIVTIEQIQKKVAEHFEIRPTDMTSRRRPKNIAFPRQVAMYLARELTRFSLSEIGHAFGGRDHGTVLHAHRLVKAVMAESPKTRQTVSFLVTELKRGR